MSLKDLIKKWRKYSELSNLGIIVRRKFFNNCFDGALTCAGIISGSFIIFLASPDVNLSSAIIIITGFSTALAIGISGLWGAFLSEEAEREKKMIDLKKEMAIFEKEKEEKTNNKEKNGLNNDEKEILEDQEIQKAMVAPINLNHTNNKRFLSSKGNPKKKKRINHHCRVFSRWRCSCFRIDPSIDSVFLWRYIIHISFFGCLYHFGSYIDLFRNIFRKDLWRGTC